jgi:hypothetical protein
MNRSRLQPAAAGLVEAMCILGVGLTAATSAGAGAPTEAKARAKPAGAALVRYASCAPKAFSGNQPGGTPAGDTQPGDGQQGYPEIERAVVVGGDIYTLSEQGVMVSDMSSLSRVAWLPYQNTAA